MQAYRICDDGVMGISRSLRFQILKRDGFACYYCHANDIELTIDHVLPEALGGDDDPTNLVAACQPCNSGKAAIPPDEKLVQQVAEDGLRWSRAVEEAARIRAHERFDQEITRIDFYHNWTAWTYRDGTTVDLPRDWENSIDRFIEAGLEHGDLDELIRVAMTAQTKDEWRYFCGCCWTRIRQSQAVARALIDREKVADKT